MARVARNLKELAKMFAPMLEKAMLNDVADEVKKEEINQIEEKVFFYTPKVYERRDKNGLDDPSNMIPKTEIKNGEVTLTVTNETVGKDDPNFYIAGLIEYGDQNGYGEYDYAYDPYAEYLKPRRFIEGTREALEANKKHVEGLKRGLKKQGIQIK